MLKSFYLCLFITNDVLVGVCSDLLKILIAVYTQGRTTIYNGGKQAAITELGFLD